MSLRARVGVGAVAAGVLLVGVDAVVGGVPSPTRVAVWVVAAGLASVAFFGVVERGITVPEAASLPSVGHGYEVPVPGDEFAAMDDYDRRQYLRDYVARTLVRERGIDRETADEAVEGGTWTDDEAAAKYLSERTARAPVGVRLRLWWGKESLDEWWLGRVVRAVRDLREGEA